MPLFTKDSPGLLSFFAGGVRLTVKAKPGASRTRGPRLVPLAGDRWAVEIAVTEAPEGGKANKAILAFLASELGLKKSDLAIKTGLASRLKVIEIAAEDAQTAERIRQWLRLLPSA